MVVLDLYLARVVRQCLARTSMARFLVCFLLLSLRLSCAKKVLQGLPVSISCMVTFPRSIRPRGGDIVRCQIIRTSDTVFNSTMRWRQARRKYYVFDAEKNETISVMLTYKGEERQRRIKIRTKKPPNICRVAREDREPKRLPFEPGKDVSLACLGPRDSRRRMEKKSFEKMSFAFYRDCIRISESDTVLYSYASNYENYKFGGITVMNASQAETSGLYFCAILYKERQYVFMGMKPTKVSMKDSSIHVPTIQSSQRVYETVPGGDLILKCNVKVPGDHPPLVNWYRENKEIHYRDNTIKFVPGNSGSWEIEYNISGVDTADSGNYSCSVASRGRTALAYFTVAIKKSEKEHVQPWLLAVITGVSLVIFILAIVIVYRRSTHIQYSIKKYLKTPIQVPEDTSIAFLVYCGDVFRASPDENPLKDLTEWLSLRNIRYTDLNLFSTSMNQEVPAPENIKEAIKSSMSLVIILSRDLLVKNDMESYSSYMGFDHNVESTQNVIFICTEEMKKVVFEDGILSLGEVDSTDHTATENTIRTFKNIMKRKNNFVVYWSPKKLAQFQKSVYLALPKVKISKCENDIVLSNNGATSIEYREFMDSS